jgi:putative ABC transport system substrate-binding protein
MNYRTGIADVFRQLGAYAGRILKGAKPGDLPIEMPNKYELVISAVARRLSASTSRRLCLPAPRR